MLIQSSSKKHRSKILIDKYIELIKSGVNSSEILLLAQNPFKRQKIFSILNKELPAELTLNANIHTFSSLVYNTILKNETLISDNANINLSGLELSQYIFKKCIKELNFKDYNSKINLLHQLFRRYSLIVNNGLSDKDVEEKETLLGEAFSLEAQNAIDLFRKKTFELKTFDYIRQIPVFKYLCNSTECFSNIKYLVADDLDEYTKAQFDFLEFLLPKLQDYFLGYDRFGSSRIGFLGAYRDAESKILSFIKEKPIIIDSENKIVDELYNSILNNKTFKSESCKNISASLRNDSIDKCVSKIKELFALGNEPSDIKIIVPSVETSSLSYLYDILQKNDIPYQQISGSEKLVDDFYIKSMLKIIKFVDNQDFSSAFDLREILSTIFKIPVKYQQDIISCYCKNKSFNNYNFENPVYQKNYEKFKNIISSLFEIKGSCLSQKIRFLQENISVDDTSKIDFLIKEIRNFENIFDNIDETEIILQLENTIISENSSTPKKINQNAILISTPQKYIDYSLNAKYLFLLDSSNDEWEKQDTGTIYNAWVFHEEWKNEEYTYEKSTELSRLKTAKSLRKIALSVEKDIYIVGSEYDEKGLENQGGILKYFDFGNDYDCVRHQNNFVPRADQVDILNYSKGKLGVAAVPGAGKTTVLLELVLKLLKENSSAENIFVLTYMEAAAKNFKLRLKSKSEEKNRLPYISTIHGLALRILKENANYTRLKMNDNFEIIDDNMRERIIRVLFSKLKINEDFFEQYQKGISIFKLSLSENCFDKTFFVFFKAYQQALKSRNFVDYDDLLVLALKLLRENEDILTYYQNICHYIIEDEAQDSSQIQQNILELLSAKYGNLIRCGDVNQAITNTFTNSDTEVFKKFLQKNKTVKMEYSQRSEKRIIDFSNRLIDYCKNIPEYKNTFYEIKTKAVEGKNPVSSGISVNNFIFENSGEEKNFVLTKIKEITNNEPSASIAILLRNNYQVNDYILFLEENGINALSNNDTLAQKFPFRVIMSIFKMILNPWNNKNLRDNLTVLNKIGFYQDSSELLDFLETEDKSFIFCDDTDFKQSKTLQFYWDLHYWLNNICKTPDILTVEIGKYYFKDSYNIANVQIIALIIKKLAQDYKNLETLVKRLDEIANKNIPNGFNFFNCDVDKNITSGQVQVMTIHKSKGNEFDFVFLPETNEENLNTDINSIKINQDAIFEQKLKHNSKPDLQKLKINYLEENLRLFYVAITRAKKYLCILNSKTYKKFGRVKKSTDLRLMSTLIQK